MADKNIVMIDGNNSAAYVARAPAASSLSIL